jgi:hypothetical protein
LTASRFAVGALLLSAFTLAGCNTTGDLAIYRRASDERVEALELEVERLRTDLARAEETLVAAESGLRGTYGRADAVSLLAEARIRIASAASKAPWRAEEIREAKLKLEEAERQIDDESFGAALFFVYRARRIADQVELEGLAVAMRPGTRFISSDRVNLRSGPATSFTVVAKLRLGTPVFPERTQDDWVLVQTMPGSVGWVHETLVGDPPATAPPASR